MSRDHISCKEIRAVLQDLPRGWTYEPDRRGGGHLSVFAPDGRRAVRVPGSPRDGALAAKRLRTRLRKAGCPVR
jgi:hypothetical protein